MHLEATPDGGATLVLLPGDATNGLKVQATVNVTTNGITDPLPAGTNTLGAFKDAGPNWTTVWGVSGVPFASADQHSGVASVTDAPTAGQKVVIDDLIFSADTTMSVTFKCETSGAVVAGPFYVLANTTQALKFRGRGPKLATADKKLQVITSVSGNVMVLAGYHSEA